jgi:negative regulator of sigma E activity
MSMDKKNPGACEAYEARLEDYLSGESAGADLLAHVKRCVECRAALESGRVASELLREGMEPAAMPHPAFATRVMAQIRAEESAKGGASDLWGALEVLARRLALTAALALVALGVYAGMVSVPQDQSSNPPTEATAKYPSLVGQTSSSDEVLQAFADVNHGR